MPTKWFSARGRKLRLLDSASGYPADEPIEKKIVRDRHRDAGDQGAGHDLAPVEDVTADEIGRHAKRDRLLIGRGYESQRVDELLQGQREGEDHHRQDPRQRQRDRHLDEGAEQAAAVDDRCLFDLDRQRLEESHQQPGAERDGEGRINDDQRPHRVLQARARDHPRQWQEQERRRHEVGEKDADPQGLAVAAGHAREAVGGRQRGDEGDSGDAEADDQGVQQPGREQGFLEQIAEVLERGRIVEPERNVSDIVEVGVRLERGDHHPIERKGREDQEKRDRAVERGLSQTAFVTVARGMSDLPPPDEAQHHDHHDQQERQHEQRDGRAVRHIAGNDADLETRRSPGPEVAPTGPPLVIRKTMDRSVKVNTMPKIRPMATIGRIIGRMIW